MTNDRHLYPVDMEVAQLYVQPHSMEAEQALLGAVLLQGAKVIDDLQPVHLVPASFYRSDHRHIWAVMQDLLVDGRPVDIVTVSDRLNHLGRLERAGGFAYLAELAAGTPSAANARAYAAVVSDRAIEREWIEAANRIQESMHGDGLTHPQRVAACQQIITELSTERRPATSVDLATSVDEYLEHLDWRHANPGIHGLRTGFAHIDYRLQGMQPGNLMVIGGRPSMGKTTYLTNIIRQAAADSDQRARVKFFSLEMSRQEIAQRMIAAQGRIKMGLLKSAKVLDHPPSVERLGDAVGKLRQLGVILDDDPALTVEDIAARARRESRRGALDCVVVDHLALVDPSDRRANETDRIAHTTRGLKKLAKELGTVVIAISQLNREVEKRGNKRPMMSDLRSSGAVEQDADVVQFLYRDEYYNDSTAYPGQIEIITAKARDGELGSDYLAWMGQYNLIGNLAQPADQPGPDKDYTPA